MTEQPWPWRVLISGVFADSWRTATADERQQAYIKLIALHRKWQQQGARLICTMDNISVAGEPHLGDANFYSVWEIPTPELINDFLDPLWDNKAGTPLTNSFSLHLTLGKPIISIERDLGGVQLATPATAEGEMPPIPLPL